MNKKLSIPMLIGCILVGIGIILCIVAGVSSRFHFRNFFDREPSESVRQQISLKGDETVEIESSDPIRLIASSDECLRLTYYEDGGRTYDFIQNDRSVRLLQKPIIGWFWFMPWGNREIVVEIPSHFKGNVRLKGATGDIRIDELTEVNKIDISNTTGDIAIGHVTAENIRIATTTGDIRLEDGSANESASLSVTTGDLTLGNLFSKKDIHCSSTTGEIFAQTLQGQSVNLSATTGNVYFEKLDGEIVNLHTSTGEIGGTLAGSIADYSITSNTSTGSCSLPNSLTGGARQLKASASTGNIAVNFAGN